ncbi:MAG: heat-inducible transcriptional repressor HrcA [Bifidobacterium asteroides]
MPNTRRMLVLRAVVEDYIRSREPVGSGSLTRSHQLGVSSATVRNDMAALESEGYLVQPHTSAGRIPTQKGYRYFVDKLATIVPLSAAQRRGINAFLSGSVNLEDTLQHAAQLLAQITGQIAVVASPSLASSNLRRAELIGLSRGTVLMVVITDTGRVVQRTLHGPLQEDPNALADLSDQINRQCQDLPLDRAADRCRILADSLTEGRDKSTLRLVAAVFDEMATREQTSGLYMAGTSQLTHSQAVSLGDLGSLLDALEEQVVLMRLMRAQSELSRESNGVSVAIGTETRTPELVHASVVTSGYGHARCRQTDGSEADEPVAFVGSIGPTHMDYPATMSAVRAVASYLTGFLAGDGEP